MNYDLVHFTNFSQLLDSFLSECYSVRNNGYPEIVYNDGRFLVGAYRYAWKVYRIEKRENGLSYIEVPMYKDLGLNFRIIKHNSLEEAMHFIDMMMLREL